MSIVRLLRAPAFYLQWAILFGFWYALSGFNKSFYLGVGGLSAAVVAAFTYDLQFSEPTRAGDRPVPFYTLPWHRLALYAAWLMKEIVLANGAVLRIVFDPRLPADPAMLRYRTRLQGALARTILANSITLTPGTITVDIEGDEFVVHALVGGESAVAGIAAMEDRIAQALAGIDPLPQGDA